MCVVAVLNGADYEFEQHSAPFLVAGGSQDQLDALRALGAARGGLAPTSTGPSVRPWCWPIEMTRDVQVSAAAFAAAKAAVPDERALVELVGVKAYNMVRATGGAHFAGSLLPPGRPRRRA